MNLYHDVIGQYSLISHVWLDSHMTEDEEKVSRCDNRTRCYENTQSSNDLS